MLAIRGELVKYVHFPREDPAGLSRWNCVNISNGTHKCRLISSYQSIRLTTVLRTVCCQQRRYFRARNISTCPRKLRIQYLEQFIAMAINSGRKVILTIDTKEHMVNRKLAKELQRLCLIEAYYNKFQTESPASYFRGSRQID